MSQEGLELDCQNDPFCSLPTSLLRLAPALAGTYGGYAGLPPDADLSSDEIDKKVSIRFQTTFLPVPEDKSDLGTLEFCTEARTAAAPSAAACTSARANLRSLLSPPT